MVRSIVLRGFDQVMANRIKDFMQKYGTKFINESIPIKFSRQENGKILVDYQNTKENIKKSEEFDTVLLAIGRSPETHRLGLEDIGVKLAKNGKIIVGEDDTSSISNIFSIGDCAEGRPELTPPAIMAGRLLARRLYNKEKKLMSYEYVATTVFTPLEMGTIGYTDEQAFEK